jgi:hypothetical protein
MRWLQVVLILPVGGSVSSSLSVYNCRHFRLEEIIETCALYFSVCDVTSGL